MLIIVKDWPKMSKFKVEIGVFFSKERRAKSQRDRKEGGTLCLTFVWSSFKVSHYTITFLRFICKISQTPGEEN